LRFEGALKRSKKRTRDMVISYSNTQVFSVMSQIFPVTVLFWFPVMFAPSYCKESDDEEEAGWGSYNSQIGYGNAYVHFIVSGNIIPVTITRFPVTVLLKD